MKAETIVTILFLFLGQTFAAPEKASLVEKQADPLNKHRELNSVWSSFLNLIHPPGQINHSIAASSTDVTDTDSAQSISSTSSTYLNESNEYTVEDQNDTGDASASTLSGATVWMYVVSGVVLLSLLGIAYRKTREENILVAKVNLIDEECPSTVEAVEVETERKKAWCAKFRRRKNKQTDVQMVSV